jgi:hypothetical protein
VSFVIITHYLADHTTVGYFKIQTMSDLQRSFAKTHLPKSTLEPVPVFDEREEDEDELSALPLESRVSDSSSSASSTGTIVPSPGKNLFERPKGYISCLILLIFEHPRLPLRVFSLTTLQNCWQGQIRPFTMERLLLTGALFRPH